MSLLGKQVEKHSTLGAVIIGLTMTINLLGSRLDAAAEADAALQRSVQHIVDRISVAEELAQKRFTLIRDLREDVTANDKQIMILQVNDQQMWATIDDIRKYVPSSISALEARMVAVEKDVTRIEGAKK